MASFLLVVAFVIASLMLDCANSQVVFSGVNLMTMNCEGGPDYPELTFNFVGCMLPIQTLYNDDFVVFGAPCSTNQLTLTEMLPFPLIIKSVRPRYPSIVWPGYACNYHGCDLRIVPALLDGELTCIGPVDGDEQATSYILETSPVNTNLFLKSESAMECQSNYNIGAVSSAGLCAAVALRTEECDTENGVRIMWDDDYSVNEPSWGCRCCVSGSSFSTHDIWKLKTFESSHWIAAGNPSNSKWNGIPTSECVLDSSAQASQGTVKSADIAVSCCDDSGSGVRVFDGACYHAKTYNEAEGICFESGHRLCSLAEMLNQATKGAGCNHDARYNWVWDECAYERDETAHYVAQGRVSWGGWGSVSDFYCQSNDDNQAAYDSSKHSRNIGVSCCSMDGTTGARPDCNAHPATYQEAVELCSANGMRLCSLDEMMTGVTEGTGCSYDAAYNWVADGCDDIALDASASGNIYGPDEATTSDQVRNFEDFIPMVLGAAAGIVVIAVIVATVVMMRKKKVAEEVVNEMADINSAPDASSVPVDGTGTSST